MKSTARQVSAPELVELSQLALLIHAPLKAVYSIMPIQMADTFLAVVGQQGLGVSEYAKRLGQLPNVMTRHMLDLGETNRRHEPGLGLVYTVPDPMNRRKHQVYLTPKGEAVAYQMALALKATQ